MTIQRDQETVRFLFELWSWQSILAHQLDHSIYAVPQALNEAHVG